MENPTLESLQESLAQRKEVQAALQKSFAQLKKDKAPKDALDAKLSEMKDAKGRVEEQEKQIKQLYPDANAKPEAKQKGKGRQQQAKAETAQQGENFGKLPLNQSSTRRNLEWSRIDEFTAAQASKTVWFRARLQAVRGKSAKLAFLILRQRSFTIQGVITDVGGSSRDLIKFVQKIPPESLVNVHGTLRAADITSRNITQHGVELDVKELWIESESVPDLPLSIEDASREITLIKEQKRNIKKITAEIEALKQKLETSTTPEEKQALQKQMDELATAKGVATKYSWPGQKVRLDNRFLDLRTPANQAIFIIQSAVGTLFRERLLAQHFVEIHSPKMLGAASEGGAQVFKVQYFDQSAFLAQSPQLYKQMAICADFDRVFEVGPVFRAETAFTHRHLTEFVGLDLEMTINEHYHEVLDVLDDLFLFIFEQIELRFARELQVINAQFPFEPLKYKRPSPRVLFSKGVEMLRAEVARLRKELGAATRPEDVASLKEQLIRALGVNSENEINSKEIGDFEDFTTPQEKLLGSLVRKEHGVDFYILDKFPADVRPFYTMIDPTDPHYTNSYDLFIRNEEICSGAQRIHDSAMLAQRATAKGVPVSSIADYVNSFKYGAPPHGGGGVGLERVVMLYLGLGNIRKSSLFPRDPSRLTP